MYCKANMSEAATMEEMAPPPKKRRGRPRKSGSMTPSQSDTNSQRGFSPRFPSVDLDAWTDNYVAIDHHPVTTTLTSGKYAVPIASVEDFKEVGKEAATTGEEVMAQKAVLASGIVERQSEPLQLVAVGETSIDSTNFSYRTGSAKNAMEPMVVEAAAVSNMELALNEQLQIDALAQIEEEEAKALTTKSLVDRLRNIIGDLGQVALTREEVSSFEDMFMDAKEQLYGAGRRGRALNS
jgi:hypothetical protein